MSDPVSPGGALSERYHQRIAKRIVDAILDSEAEHKGEESIHEMAHRWEVVVTRVLGEVSHGQ